MIANEISLFLIGAGIGVLLNLSLRPKENEWKDKIGDDLVKELQDHVKHTTAPYKYPRQIEFVDELPKTISGKIRRVEIRSNHANPHAHAS